MPEKGKELRLHFDAEIDLQMSVSFYRERGGEKLANRFKLEVEAGFTTIVRTPERFPFTREDKRVQRIRLKQFPFSILYVNRQDHAWVVAIAHGSRKPGYWQERLG